MINFPIELEAQDQNFEVLFDETFITPRQD